MNVSAKDLGTGKEQSIHITGSTKLSDAEIERMKKEAKEHEEEDKKRKEKIEIRNIADSLVNSTEKALQELKDKFSSEDKENLEKALKELQEALTGDDTDTIKEKTDALTQAFQKASTTIYQQAAQQHQQQPGQDTAQGDSWQGHPSEDDSTINADYKVKGEKKKKKDEDAE
jgi:molecular chaperone DnaK